MTDISVVLPKSLALLSRLAAEGQPLPLASLLSDSGLSSVDAHTAVRTLLTNGYLRSSSGNAGRGTQKLPEFLELGPAAIKFATQVRRSFTAESHVMPHLRRLVKSTGETSSLNVYMPSMNATSCMAFEKCEHEFGYSVELGEMRPLHAGAAGLVVLGLFDAGDRAAALASTPLTALTELTLTDPGAVQRMCEDVARDGYCITRGDRIVGAIEVGVPLLLPDNIPAAIVVTAPEYRCAENQLPNVIQAALRCAGDLKCDLG